MTSAALRGLLFVVTTASTALLVLAPAPGESVDVLLAPGSAADVTAPLVAAVTLGAWGVTGWLAGAVALTVLAHLPGATGRGAGFVARRTAPPTVRRAVELALGLSVAAGALGASPALAAGASGPGLAHTTAASPAVVPPPLDWPGRPATPGLDWPVPPVTGPATATETATETATTTETRPAAAAMGSDGIVVRPGDTLWGVAERALLDRDARPPTTAAVAAAWPTWWAANRDVVGDDPDLIRPGVVLRPPAG